MTLLDSYQVAKYEFIIKGKKNDVRNRNNVFLIKKHQNGLLGVSFALIYGTLSRSVALQRNPVQ